MKKHIVPLMNKVGHLSLIKSHAKLDKLGLYKGQPPLLDILFEKDGRTQKEIVDILIVSRATVSKMVSRMESRGLLKIAKNAGDSRGSKIYLTEKAKKLEKELENLNSKISEVVLKDFTEKDKKEFERLLLKAKKNLS